MSRPFVLRLLPESFRESAYYRLFHTKHDSYRSLFERASLTLAPTIAMFDLVVGDVISGNIAFTGAYEFSLSHRVADLARDGGALVDVGANMGYFSLLWAGQNSNARAIAFEASPRNVELFRTNVPEPVNESETVERGVY